MRMVNEQRRLQDSGSIGRQELLVTRADKIVDKNRPTHEEVQDKQIVFDRLRTIIHSMPRFAGCVVQKHGWSNTAFDMKGSKLDVVVFTEDYIQRSDSDWASVLGTIENARELGLILVHYLQESHKDEFLVLPPGEPMVTLKAKATSIVVNVTVHHILFSCPCFSCTCFTSE